MFCKCHQQYLKTQLCFGSFSRRPGRCTPARCTAEQLLSLSPTCDIWLLLKSHPAAARQAQLRLKGAFDNKRDFTIWLQEGRPEPWMAFEGNATATRATCNTNNSWTLWTRGWGWRCADLPQRQRQRSPSGRDTWRAGPGRAALHGRPWAHARWRR